jgi:hypothetical protein
VGSGLGSKSLLENRLGALVPGVLRGRRRAASGVSRKRFGDCVERLRGRAVCIPAMRAHLAVSASQSRTFCARRVGRRHRCWPETESPGRMWVVLRLRPGFRGFALVGRYATRH